MMHGKKLILKINFFFMIKQILTMADDERKPDIMTENNKNNNNHTIFI